MLVSYLAVSTIGMPSLSASRALCFLGLQWNRNARTPRGRPSQGAAHPVLPFTSQILSLSKLVGLDRAGRKQLPPLAAESHKEGLVLKLQALVWFKASAPPDPCLHQALGRCSLSLPSLPAPSRGLTWHGERAGSSQLSRPPTASF